MFEINEIMLTNLNVSITNLFDSSPFTLTPIIEKNTEYCHNGNDFGAFYQTNDMDVSNKNTT